MSMKPDQRRPAISTNSRVASECGLFAQAECQNGARPEKASRFRDNLILGILAASRSRRMRIS